MADAATALRDTGSWGMVVDDRWNLAYVSDELRKTFGAGELAPSSIGHHYFSEQAQANRQATRFGSNSTAMNRALFRAMGPFVLADTPGGRDELRRLIDPELHDLIDELTPSTSSAIAVETFGTGLNDTVVNIRMMLIRLRDATGRQAGTLVVSKPAAGMHVIGSMMSMGDLRHFESMQRMASAARRPAAILFADLEGSSQLARRLPTSTYFALGRRLVRVADQCIIDNGGLVGRHVGDGVVAFFVVETIGSESAAAHACISAARSLRAAVDDVAKRSELQPEGVVLRFGLHWGSTLYVGSITTAGRAEVTALGDEVNEAARIEACATGGRALASKDLIERLDPEAAVALGIDLRHVTYTSLDDLPSATGKAIRDARAIAVCDV